MVNKIKSFMRHPAFIFFTTVALCVFIINTIEKCNKKTPEEVEMSLYGNTFISIKASFEKHPDWIEHSLMDGRCSIYLPPNLEETSLDGNTIIPKEEGTTFKPIGTNHHYCRVAIDYYKGKKGTFLPREEHDAIFHIDKEEELKPVVESTLGKENKKLLLNGPFYHIDSNSSYNDGKNYDYDIFLDAFYRRKSTVNEGTISVHIFIFQDDTDMIKLTMSLNDKDSLVFKDLFQSVKTFKWHKNVL